MRVSKLFILLLICCKASLALELRGLKDSVSGKYKQSLYDTAYIQDCRKYLSAKIAISTRFNNFTVTDSGRTLMYSINPKAVIGIGLAYKGIGFDISFAPKNFYGNLKDDADYGKTQQFAVSAGGNGRRFIYDAYIRINQGFYDTHTYPNYLTTGDTVYKHTIRPDIVNFNIGTEIVYMFNHKHFSSSAPYNFTQRQKRGAGTALLGGMFSVYTVAADSLIFHDSIKTKFTQEVQFGSAGNLVIGFSFGYTYTFVFGRKKNWYANIYTLPGLAIQQYNSSNPVAQQGLSKATLGIPFQYRFSFGVNAKRYFWGFAVGGNTYTLNTGNGADFSYKYGTFRAFYGYRFALKKEYFSKYLK